MKSAGFRICAFEVPRYPRIVSGAVPNGPRNRTVAKIKFPNSLARSIPRRSRTTSVNRVYPLSLCNKAMLIRCCGCISIPTGTKIIGTLSLIWTSLMAIAMGIFIHELQFIDSPFLTSEHTLPFIQIFIDSSLIYSVIRAVSSVVLVTASIRRAARYFLPWLAYTLSDILSGVCINLAFAIVIPGIMPIWEFFPTIVVLLSITGLQIYCWIVVYSDYRSIVLEKDSHPTDSTDAKILDQTAVNTDDYV